ncbi:CRP-like cAMP-binding protein [Lutibacter sp. Hel_I_33_5]|uniref:Crp/Fnr family transcriptional regulator n=1 Tax=Lutibacter sp. Hel_I_33_5 TaxID=1566289 RepID=UPI0011A4E37A|nr:Crp/Fnr family transcriptional regulator [Lutibacter sp. Hel_I_33_5]TVZ55716.1 CRP-like cAMP-binding protein [Lutibacter sp. Hel_I_33_5]
MKTLENFINNFHQLPKESFDKFLALTTLKEFSNKEILAEAGKIPKELFILKRGVVRSYYTDSNGKEYIRSLFNPICATGALGALVQDKPSALSYDCLTECELYIVNFKDLKKLIRNDKEIANMYANVLERIFILLEAKIYELSVLDGTQRYLKLKKEIPTIEKLIPQYHIASYLNISAVQLSRIRREINSK